MNNSHSPKSGSLKLHSKRDQELGNRVLRFIHEHFFDYFHPDLLYNLFFDFDNFLDGYGDFLHNFFDNGWFILKSN